MNEELRKSRFREYGSFLYCPRKDCLCFGRDTDQECKHAKCLLEDPEYLELQERIEENRRKNQMAEKKKNRQGSGDRPRVEHRSWRKRSRGKKNMPEHATEQTAREQETMRHMK